MTSRVDGNHPVAHLSNLRYNMLFKRNGRFGIQKDRSTSFPQERALKFFFHLLARHLFDAPELGKAAGGQLGAARCSIRRQQQAFPFCLSIMPTHLYIRITL